MVAPTEAELLIMHVRNKPQCPSSGAKRPFSCGLFPKADSAPHGQEKKRARAIERERGGKRLTRCSHRRDDRGPVEVEHSKVGLTTLRPESPCAALFIKSCKDNNES